MKAGTRFVASYSGGKDSVLAIHRAMSQGMVLQALLITYNTAGGRSWFHGLTPDILAEVETSIGAPVVLIETDGTDYAERFEDVLRRQKALGAEVCVFGDIDIEDHKSWDVARCRAAGLEAYLPLWRESRESLVRQCIEAGFAPILNVVDTAHLSPDFLGKRLDFDLMEQIKETGSDVCGENGEYHTFVVDGPLFSRPIPVKFGVPLTLGRFAVLPMEI